MVDYAKASEDKTNLRSAISGALEGGLNKFGRRPEDPADEKERAKVQHWTKELQLAEQFFKDWQEDGLRCVQAYLDDHNESLPTRPKYKLNLFNSNITTLTSIMYAKLPKVEADRRFADPGDDVARVASEIATRLLQNDMNDPDDKLAGVLRQTLQDRLVPGLGVARVRYCMEEGPDPSVLTPEDAGDDYEAPSIKTDEWCDIEYIHWRDVLWSPCRTPAEMRWIAFRCYMDKAQITERFGPDVAAHVPYASRGPSLDPSNGKAADLNQHSDRAQAEVWEIWDEQGKCVYWYVKGFDKFLDAQEDPLGLDGFFPNAPAMCANTSTLKYIPKPDYLLAEDLYSEINELECRIALLTKACKVVGVYPAAATEVQRILTEAVENQLVPVENWAMFADKGGLKGQVDYFPVKDVAEVLQILTIQQQQRIQQLYQVTGMSDIIRGQASTQGVTATEQRIKAQFASTRMQSFQDEFANFAAELLNRKLQIVRKYYDPERILRLSNILNTPDAALAEQAIALLKDEAEFDCRVVVRAESMAQIDYEALKTERAEFLGAVAGFLQSSAPLVESAPEAAPFLLELLKFNLAGMRGAKEMEGVIDQFGAAMQKAQVEKANQPPPPDPEQVKIQGQMKIEQMKAQADMEGKKADAALEQQKMRMEMQMAREEHQLKMQMLQMEIEAMRIKLGLEAQKQQMDMQAKEQEIALEAESRQQEAVLDAQTAEQEAAHEEARFEREDAHAERSFQREEKQADQSFKRSEKEAAASAKREAKRPKAGDK